MKRLLESVWTWVALVIVAIPVVFILPLVLILGGWLTYYSFVPAYSAAATIPELQARIKLDFYYTNSDDASGRYLSISTPTGSTTVPLSAYDWAHNARTSLYLTGDGKIAAVEPTFGRDVVIDPKTLSVSDVRNVDSESWNYIGAFEFAQTPPVHELRFYWRDQLPECIPGRGGPPSSDQVRKSARQLRCSR